jgi:hypothetical protein
VAWYSRETTAAVLLPAAEDLLTAALQEPPVTQAF